MSDTLDAAVDCKLVGYTKEILSSKQQEQDSQLFYYQYLQMTVYNTNAICTFIQQLLASCNWGLACGEQDQNFP